MSVKDQGHKHKWQRRVRDWLAMPQSGSAPHHRVTQLDLSSHNTDRDAWVAVDGVVYNVTPFLLHHPGGRRSILEHAGKDISAVFKANHRSFEAHECIGSCRVGVLISDEELARGADAVLRDANNSGLFRGVDAGTLRAAALEASTHNDEVSSPKTEVHALNALFDTLEPDDGDRVALARVTELLRALECTPEEMRSVLDSFSDDRITRTQFCAAFSTLS